MVGDDGVINNPSVHQVVALTRHHTSKKHRDGNKLKNTAVNLVIQIKGTLDKYSEEKESRKGRPVVLIGGAVHTFKSTVLACKWIYMRNPQLYLKYATFDDAKDSMKNMVGATIKHNRNNGKSYGKYKVANEKIINEG